MSRLSFFGEREICSQCGRALRLGPHGDLVCGACEVNRSLRGNCPEGLHREEVFEQLAHELGVPLEVLKGDPACLIYSGDDPLEFARLVVAFEEKYGVPRR